MQIKKIETKIDYIGAFASLLCLIHCLATPIFFIVTACSVSCCVSSPLWWKFIDYFFLFISINAIYFGTKNNPFHWLSLSLWFCWINLCLLIINESIGFITLPEKTNYIPALALVVLHLYNQNRNKKNC